MSALDCCRHLDKEPMWPAGIRGNLGFSASVLAWLFLFVPLYPLIELALRPFGCSAYFYYCAFARALAGGLQRPAPDSPQLKRVWFRALACARGSVRRPERQWLRPAGRADCAGRVAPAGDGSAVPACGLAPLSRQRRPAGSAIRARRRVAPPARR